MIETQLEPLADEIRASNSVRSRLISDRDSKSRELKQEIEKVRKFQIQISAIQKQINDYLNSSNEANMTRWVALL